MVPLYSRLQLAAVRLLHKEYHIQLEKSSMEP
jgi:hypothetical protein